MSTKDKLIGAAIFAALFFCLGMVFQDYMSEQSSAPQMVKASEAKPEIRDGASHLTAARSGVVESKDQQVGKPVPRTATILHTAHVTLGQPKTTINGQSTLKRGVTGIYEPKATEGPCSPIDLDLTVYREKDGGSRIDFSSPNGEVLGAAHVPSVESLAAPRKKNGIGLAAIYDGVETKPGLLLKREIPAFDINALVAQDFVSAGIVYRF